MRLGAKFKITQHANNCDTFTGFLGLHKFLQFLQFYNSGAISVFYTAQKKSWLAWASQHALILGKILTILFNDSTSITLVITQMS